MDPYADIEPLAINAGGLIAPADLVGRDALIAQLLQLAGSGASGALLLGDRRIGKTSLLGAIEQPLRDAGHVVVRVSAETESLETFERALLQALRKNPRRWNIDLGAEAKVSVGFGSITVNGKASRDQQPAEQDLFTLALGDDDPYLVVFLLDEITVLATSLPREEAGEFLRTLRRARQSSPRIVMFYAGSIGLHHAALDDTEINDLVKLHVDVLEPDDAQLLAKRLLASIELPVTSLDDVAGEMARLTSGFPFYIHGLANQLQLGTYSEVSPADVQAAFDEAVRQDLWNIRHYDARIEQYYGQDDAELVRAVLDHIARSDAPVTVDQLLEVPGVAAHAPNRTHLLALLGRLEQDHYLRREGNGDVMANDMIRGFWIHLRRL